jgi:hypothetical protein
MTQKKPDTKTAVQGVAGAVALSPEELAKISGGNIFDDIGDAFESAANAVADAVGSAVDAVGSAGQAATAAVDTAFNDAAHAVAQGLEAVTNQVASGAVDLGHYIEEGATVVYNDVALPLSDIAEDGFDSVSDTLCDIFEPLGEGVADVFSGDFSAARDNFSEGFGNAFDAIGSAVEAAHDLAGEALNEMADLTGEATNFLMSSVIAEGFEAVGFDSAADYTRSMGTFLDDTLDKMGDAAEVGLSSIGNAYGAFIEGAKNMPDFIGGLSTAVNDVMHGDFDGAQNALGESAGNIQHILAEGLSEWGKGVGGITDVMDLATKTVGELAGDLAQGFVTLSADLLAKTGGALGIEEAEKLHDYADMVNNVIGELQNTVAGQAGLFPGKKEFDILGAAAESAALLIEGKPGEAGHTFLAQCNIANSAVTAATTAYESGLGQDAVNAMQGFALHAEEFSSLVQERVQSMVASQVQLLAHAQDLAAGTAQTTIDHIQASVRQSFDGTVALEINDRVIAWSTFDHRPSYDEYVNKFSDNDVITQAQYSHYLNYYDDAMNLRAAVSTVQLAGAATMAQSALDGLDTIHTIDTVALTREALNEVRQELGEKYKPAGTEFFTGSTFGRFDGQSTFGHPGTSGNPGPFSNPGPFGRMG